MEKSKKLKKKSRFTAKQLDLFENSELFTIIDKVGHNNEEVVRHCRYNGSTIVSDSDMSENESSAAAAKSKSASQRSSEAPDGSDTLLKELFADIKTRHATKVELEKRQLHLMEQQAARQAALDERRQRLEEDQAAERKREAEDRRKTEARDRRAAEWDRAYKFLESSIPSLQAQGEKIVARLTREEAEEAN